MRQIIFRIPFLNLPIFGYGLMLVCAFLACIQVAKMMARRLRLDPELFVNMALIALVTGVIGARLSDVLENWRTYADRGFPAGLIDAINISGGGLTFYGGFFLATPCCIYYTLKHKLPLRKVMDLVAVLVMLGLGIGRIGCYLNGCCYGEICRPTWGAALTEFPYYSNPYISQFNSGLIHPPEELINRLPSGAIELKAPEQVKAEGLTAIANQQKSLPVQPTQLYSSFTGLLLALLLWSYWTIDHIDGRVFALMLMLEGPARFILELIRVEPPVVVGHWLGIDVNMSLSMVLGLVVFVAGVILWAGFGLSKTSENRRIFAAAH
jgi:phosphatidylglycerol:prolipoprotein diacylglycerol transferase